MEFWGVEVKPGQALKCEPGDDKFLHLSQAALGETKKASENVPVFVKVDNQKLILGTLSGEKCPQIQYDLVFEKEFELSHGSKSTTVYFCGYKTVQDGSEGYSDSESDDEEIQLALGANGKPEVKEDKTSFAKVDGPSAKPKAKVEEAKKSDKPKAKVEEAKKSDKPKVDKDDDEDSDDSDDSDSDEDSDDSEMPDADDDSSDEDEDDSSDEEEATPKKAENSKKRAAESATKTPAPEKKAKLITPLGGQKTGGDSKKGVHIATPHPAKKGGKTPVNDGKAKQQTPESAGSVVCKSCSKSFKSDNALQAHTKAKHSAA